MLASKNQALHCDERHLMLECPAMVPLRQKYSELFSAHISMRQLMHSPDILRLAHCVVECLKFFEALQS